MKRSSHHHEFDTVLVVDFGAQYAQLIARRVREAHVYSEIVPRDMPIDEMLSRKPGGIIFSGGPKSVHVEGAPTIDPAIYELGIPILGICYGAQLVAQQLGGEVARTGSGEYGRSALDVTSSSLQAWPQTPGVDVPPYARRGALFALGASIERKGAPAPFLDFVAAHPEHRTHDGKDLAFVPTVFDRIEPKLVDRLVYRGWWLTGATLARRYPGFAPLLPGAMPPPV